MCGIYGSTKEYDANVIKRKMTQFAFRGPDFTGIKTYQTPDANLVLAHNRLAILDLDKRANQPFEYANGNIVVVLNGEIYNFEQLKTQYFADLSFTTTSDTEVLCALYERFGTDCVDYVNGDFAFVIYDAAKQLLFGAVDRLGAKPLFYHADADGFEFASQLMPLCIGNDYQIDEFARLCYFSMQYIPSPFSIVKQVRKLNPAEKFVYDLKTKQLTISGYWDLYDNTCRFTAPKSYEEALSTAQELLDDAVRLRLKADVPLGTFLSGGIDSSTISMLAHHYDRNIEAYSVGFNETGFDESYYAKKVAESIGIKFSHIICTSREAIDVIYNLQQYYDEPMGDASAIPTSLLCEKAAQHVRVALGGDGGDEVFFGYPRYLRYAERQWIYRLPLPIRKIMSATAKSLGKDRLAMSLLLSDVQQLYMNRRPSNKADLFDAREVQQQIPQTAYLYANADVRRAFNDFDIRSLMCHAYNVKLDRASMRAALEARTPMLDYRVFEYSRLLPIEYCYTKQHGQKRMLRDMLYKEIDPQLFERPKRGFGVPIGDWFRGELKDLLLSVLNEKTVSEIPCFDPVQLIAVRDRHIAGTEDQTTLLWLCFNYLQWLEMFKSLNSKHTN